MHASVCPFIFDLKLTGQPLQAVVSTLVQDLTAGSPIGFKAAFRNSLPTTARHAVRGAGVDSHEAPGEPSHYACKHKNVRQSQFSVLGGFLLFHCIVVWLLCYRCCQTVWACGSTVNGVAEGQSIHLVLRHMASFQSCQGWTYWDPAPVVTDDLLAAYGC